MIVFVRINHVFAMINDRMDFVRSISELSGILGSFLYIEHAVLCVNVPIKDTVGNGSVDSTIWLVLMQQIKKFNLWLLLI